MLPKLCAKGWYTNTFTFVGLPIAPEAFNARKLVIRCSRVQVTNDVLDIAFVGASNGSGGGVPQCSVRLPQAGGISAFRFFERPVPLRYTFSDRISDPWEVVPFASSCLRDANTEWRKLQHQRQIYGHRLILYAVCLLPRQITHHECLAMTVLGVHCSSGRAVPSGSTVPPPFLYVRLCNGRVLITRSYPPSWYFSNWRKMSKTPKLSLVVAMCNNRGIGVNGNLPWKLR